MKLVFIQNNQPVTDSLTVAEAFGKRHSDVLRDIRRLKCSEGFRESNFFGALYQDVTGRRLPKYIMTREGFLYLVMGYTGKDAGVKKEEYINEFNSMELGDNPKERKEIKNLVFIDNDRVVTDSLTVAEVFGKEHRRVMQDIRELECSEGFRLHNFVQSTYTNAQQREMPKYIITEKGFTFLVMGYTGKQAAEFKERYIDEFERMKEELKFGRPSYMIADPVERAERWIREEKERQALKNKIEEDRPKVVFAEALETSADSIMIADLAKILKQNGIDIGQNRLIEVLREDGYLCRRGSYRNAPTQKAMNLGLFEVATTVISSEGTVKTVRAPRVTAKGQIYFVNRFKRQKNQMYYNDLFESIEV